MKNIKMINLAHKTDSLRTDLLVIAMILIAGLKYTFGLENVLDINLYDESSYLYQGVTLMSAGLPSAESAPLYAIWYFFISLFEPNRISLYYLNFKLMTILPPVLVYTLLRRNRVSVLTSFIISWSLLLLRANAYTGIKVSHFALIVILSIFILVSYTRSHLWASFFASIGALIVSYVRPEYFLAYMLSLLLFILAIVLYYRKQKRLPLTSLSVYALISILLLGVFGSPLSGSRSMVAFGQHFSLHWVSWTGSDINPWTNWQTIVSQNFGSASNIWVAFVNNPSAFLKHVTYNLWEFIKYFSTQILPSFFPRDIFSKCVVALSFIGLCVANIANIRKNFLEHRNLLILIGLFLLPGLVSVVVIYPRAHHILLLGVLTIVLMAILLDSHPLEQKASESQAIQVSHKQLLLLGSLMIALTPYFSGQVNTKRPNLNTIRFIQSLRIEEPVNLLEAEGGFHYYLDDNFHRVAEYEKNTDFDRFLQKKNINMIVVTEVLLEDTRFRDDTNWRDFLADYPTFGYVQMDIPHTDRKLFIRIDILQR